MSLEHPRSQEFVVGGEMTPLGNTTDKRCGQYVCTGLFVLVVVAIWLVSGTGIPDNTHAILWAAFAVVPLVVACGCGFRCAAEQQREAARQGSCRLYSVVLGLMLVVLGVSNMASSSVFVGACVLLVGATGLWLTWYYYALEHDVGAEETGTLFIPRPQNQLSGVTEPGQGRNSQYRDLHIDIPPHADFFVQESPPPSYEASSFSKPVATPPPTYSAAVDLAGTPPVWDVPAVHQPTTPRQTPRDGDGSPTWAAGEPRHSSD